MVFCSNVIIFLKYSLPVYLVATLATWVTNCLVTYDAIDLFLQVMSGSHSMTQHTRTTVVWPWRTLEKGMTVPCSAWLGLLLVANSLNLGSGFFQMKLKFPAMVPSLICTEPEVRWWYFWTAEEVERRGSTTVRYLIQWMLTRPYTLKCTQQAVVSGICTLNYFVSNIRNLMSIKLADKLSCNQITLCH